MKETVGYVTTGEDEKGNPALVVRCEPHVRTRLKLVFPRVKQQASEFVALTVTPENCRDLAWFLDRYPMEVRDGAGDLLSTGTEKALALQERMVSLFNGEAPVADAPLAKPARDYQSFAAEFLAVRKGLLLADDVGTGKTITAICSLVRQECRPALVVCLTHLTRHWESKIREFAPNLLTHVATKGKAYPLVPVRPAGALFEDPEPDVIILNYAKLGGWADYLAGKVKLVVFDEVQELRRNESMKYAAAVLVSRSGDFSLGLSATPIYNYGTEWFNVLDCLNEDALGSRDEFHREWCRTDMQRDKATIRDTEAFGAYLRDQGLMLRRTRKDVGRELPPVQKILHEVQADPHALADVRGAAVALAKIILDMNEDKFDRMNAGGRLDAMLRQATGIAKAPYVAEFVKLLLEGEEKVILFGWHHEVYGIWKEALADYKPRFFTGRESDQQKKATEEAFIHGDCRVLVMSLRSGAGVDGLQAVCRTCVLGELDWSPGVHEQCIGRLDRDGQTDPVAAYFLTSDQGSDPVVVDVLGIKREQIEGVRNPGTDLVERLEQTGEHILKLARSLLEKETR